MSKNYINSSTHLLIYSPTHLLTYSIILILLFINSCDKYKTNCVISSQEENDTFLNKTRIEFSRSGFGDEFLHEFARINWNSYSEIQTDSALLLYEFIILTNEKKSINHETYADTIYYSLLAYETSFNQIKMKILEWIPLKNNKYQRPEYMNTNHFSGLLNSYSLDGELLQSDYFTAGKEVSRLPREEIKNLKIKADRDNVLLKAPPVGCDCWFPIWLDNYTDWYQTASQGGGSSTTYLGREYTGKTLIYVFIPADGGGGGTSGYEQTITRTAVHGPRYSNTYSSKEQFYDEQVLLDKSFASNEWLNCIYDRLVKIDAFRQALLKFTGEYPVIHLRFDVGDIAPNDKGVYPIGRTSPPTQYVSRIRINSRFASNYSTLLMAKTLIHEVIHAEMYRKLMELANSDGRIDPLLVEKYLSEDNYPGLFDYYRRYGLNSMQHELMAAHYVGILANILKEFDNNLLTIDEYEALVWQGSLSGTSTYKDFPQGLKIFYKGIFDNVKEYGTKLCIN